MTQAEEPLPLCLQPTLAERCQKAWQSRFLAKPLYCFARSLDKTVLRSGGRPFTYYVFRDQSVLRTSGRGRHLSIRTFR